MGQSGSAAKNMARKPTHCALCKPSLRRLGPVGTDGTAVLKPPHQHQQRAIHHAVTHALMPPRCNEGESYS